MKPMPTVREALRKGMRDAHARRPLSFYLLLAIPVVLLLGVQLGNLRERPGQFVLVLSLMFLFFFIVSMRALFDLIEITRAHLKADRASFRETLGESAFLTDLGERVRAGRDAGGFAPPEGGSDLG